MPIKQQIVVPGGTVNVNSNSEWGHVLFQDDGSVIVSIDVNLNGARKTRTLVVSAGGTVFALDGQTINTPPLELRQFGAHLAATQTLGNAMLALPGIVAALTGP